MILALMAGLIGLTVLALLLRSVWIRAALNVRQTVLTLGVAAILIVIVGLAVAGRLNWIVAAVAAAIPFVRSIAGFARLAPWLKSVFAARNPTSTGPRSNSSSDAGDTSTESPFFRMTLHHASGHMDGEIKQGRHKNRFLSELSFTELAGLLGEIQDYDSQRLLESYLDHHYPQWRQNRQRDTAGEEGPGMSRSEALEALGLADGAARDEIVAAHRRLIQRLHPDRGGSTYLASLLNRAKDVLLDEH